MLISIFTKSIFVVHVHLLFLTAQELVLLVESQRPDLQQQHQQSQTTQFFYQPPEPVKQEQFLGHESPAHAELEAFGFGFAFPQV